MEGTMVVCKATGNPRCFLFSWAFEMSCRRASCMMEYFEILHKLKQIMQPQRRFRQLHFSVPLTLKLSMALFIFVPPAMHSIINNSVVYTSLNKGYFGVTKHDQGRVCTFEMGTQHFFITPNKGTLWIRQASHCLESRILIFFKVASRCDWTT